MSSASTSSGLDVLTLPLTRKSVYCLYNRPNAGAIPDARYPTADASQQVRGEG